ncbi:MAG TPA: alanine--tRNA ligase [Candidatus Aenigmarchaeota archaeon]|nr:MAG: alanine--tRNA ligase [Candidatus Aenigmarchaeota archaeon]HDD45940.1 alanine--tRNA ligase [Candidatus Aenigmarchaeota archaeon]
MLTKEKLKAEFSKDWKRHYEVEVFREKGFTRKICKRCGKAFWSIAERELCGTPSCENYGFIGKPITKRKLDYIEAWHAFEKFFVKHGHASVDRYPVVDRWRPDLYFTIASIQDFQRIDNNQIIMEYPADPLIVPQVCLRFNDIPNVGVTGRHHTSFIMSGQHSFGKYWKDECIELNFEFINKVLGVPEEEIIYVEDLWAMPDFSQFGPSLETFSKALELVNSVFSQFTAQGNGYAELSQKVIDVGWGHERIVWFTQGSVTGYEAVFGPVARWAKKQAGIEESKLFKRYALLAGSMSFDESNIERVKREIANKLNVSVSAIDSSIRPMQALYAILDHTKTLLFAIADGAIPSNVGGGYNLRVLLRRVFSFIDEYNFDLDIVKLADMHAKFLKPLFPELSGAIDIFSDIVTVERSRYRSSRNKAKAIVKKIIEKNETIDSKKLIQLYTSNGVTPELIKEVASEMKKSIIMPEDFYAKLTEMHMTKKKEKKKAGLEVNGIKETELLFYEDAYAKEFDATVVKVIGEWVVLDRTLFYPEGGGQPCDKGVINGKKVRDVQKIGGVVLHRVDGRFKEGEKVHGAIDWKRRYRLMKMHTATHIIAGAARKIFGKHVWQAGTQKGYKLSRLDLTHYKPFTQDDLKKIERLANDIVKQKLNVGIRFMKRGEAEKEYGFVLYQGGASPGKIVRVIRIPAEGEIFDVEACGGTHLNNTGEIERIKIIASERVQDGVNRLEFSVAEAALEFEKKDETLFNNILEAIRDFVKVKKRDDIERQIANACDVFSVGKEHLLMTFKKFCNAIIADINEINKLNPSIKKSIWCKDVDTLADGASYIFQLWKRQRKEIEKLKRDASQALIEKLLKKIKNHMLIEIVDMDRKGMIALAESILKEKSNVTVVLANKNKEIVVMSNSEDAAVILRDIINKCGGAGGGKGKLAQGKIEHLEKLK